MNPWILSLFPQEEITFVRHGFFWKEIFFLQPISPWEKSSSFPCSIYLLDDAIFNQKQLSSFEKGGALFYFINEKKKILKCAKYYYFL